LDFSPGGDQEAAERERVEQAFRPAVKLKKEPALAAEVQLVFLLAALTLVTPTSDFVERPQR
jgi:hypothetical protein